MPRARLDVRGEVAMSGGELRYGIANEGDFPLLFGAGYGFEEATAEGWQPVHIRQAFAAWGGQIAPGDRHSRAVCTSTSGSQKRESRDG